MTDRSWVLYVCPDCGGGDVYPRGSDPGYSHCYRSHNSGKHPAQERVVVADVAAAADWLRHIDRLDEIDGARYPGLRKNPLWDAGFALEREFGGSA